jgi:hypothetical protein
MIYQMVLHRPVELATGFGKFLLNGLNELIDEVKIRLTGDSLVTPAEVLGIS